MRRIKFSFGLAGAAAACALVISCTGNGMEETCSPLNIGSVTADAVLSRAAVSGTTLPSSESSKGLGLYLRTSGGAAYSSTSSNVKYYNIGDGWTSDASIMLTGTTGNLYGYFPYSASVTDIASVPVVSSVAGDDYMYAVPVSGVSSSNSNVSLQMKHALAKFTVTFAKDDKYSGAGSLTSMSITSAGVAANGVLNATTGAVSATSSTVVFPFSPAQTVTTSGLVEECLLVPAGSATTPQSLTLGFVIDGTEYSYVLDGDKAVAIAQGVSSSVNVLISASGVSVMDVWTGKWTDGGTASFSVDGSKTVTVSLASGVSADDILFSVYAEGASMRIDAFSMTGKALACTVPSTCTCVSSYSPVTHIHTFLVSGPDLNINAVLGYSQN